MNTKFYLFTFMILILLGQNSFSQVSREWLSVYNFNTEDQRSLAVDASGNSYVTGMSGADYATVKYNSSGVQQWVSKYNGPGNSTDLPFAIAVDASGNVYVTGSSIGTVSNYDFLTIKYNSSGVQQWTARYDGPSNSFDNAFAVAVDISGNVYVTGNSLASSTNYDYATIKYNSSGVLQWAKRYNGLGNNSDNAYRLALDGMGNVYVTGWSRGTGAYDDDYVTIKYSSTGDSTWVRRYGGRELGYDQPRSIAVDASGNVYVTGKSEGTGTQNDYATIKYNSSGDSLWVKRYNGPDNGPDIGSSIAVDTSGNVYVSGQSYSNTSDYDFLTIKYNSSGIEQWLRTFNGPGNSVDNENAMTLDNSGNVYITGSSNLSGQSYNYATVKYNSSGTEQWNDIYNGPLNASDQPFSIGADSSGKIYISGTSAGDYVTIKYSQNPYALITGFIEGFYNSSSDKMVSDTMRVYLRNTASPYNIADSSISILDSSGKGRFYFSNISNGTNYYIVLKHRNSIETWSSSGQAFTSGSLSYDFSSAVTQAFGNNMVMADATPLRFAAFSGDANQDGSVNLTDIVKVFNDGSVFITGYSVSDMNGDNSVNLTDLIFTFNNSSKFISVKKP